MLATLYFILLIAKTYAFMYQRTTLTLARVMKGMGEPSEIPNIQAILTPTWLGTVSTISTFGSYILYVLIFIYYGWVWAVGAFIFSFVLMSFVPIPSKHFFNAVNKHLSDEAKRADDPTKKEGYQELIEHIKDMQKTVRV